MRKAIAYKNTIKEIDGKRKSIKEFDFKGIFHGFNTDSEEGIGNFPVAIIEDDMGFIHLVYAEFVQLLPEDKK